jgi:hypothetical protein
MSVKLPSLAVRGKHGIFEAEIDKDTREKRMRSLKKLLCSSSTNDVIKFRRMTGENGETCITHGEVEIHIKFWLGNLK